MTSTAAASRGDNPRVAKQSALQLWSVEILAGALVAAVQIAQATSYVALIFQGGARAGLGIALWATLAGVAIVGVFLGRMTSLPPLCCGPDTPTLAVSSVVGAGIAAHAIAAGMPGDLAAVHVLMALTIATALGAAAMLALGLLGFGQSLRFIPYPVVAGFLAATGWLVLVGGVKLVLAGISLPDVFVAASSSLLQQIGVAIVFALALVNLRKLVKSPFLLPALVVLFSGAILVAQNRQVLTGSWFLTGGAGLQPWVPVRVLVGGTIDWSMLLRAGPEILAIVIVTLISLVVKIATVEFNRATSADFNREILAHGVGNAIAAPLGGLSMSLLLSGTRLASDAGSKSWRSAIVASVVVAIVVATGADLVRVLPVPVLGGLLMFLGYGLLTDALRAPLQQRAWQELSVALAIMLVCVTQGYIVGVLAGLVAGCLIFAISYARVGVIHRHLTRATFGGNVSRPREQSAMLREHGNAVQIYWLTGYIFFGSSEQVFERVKADIEAAIDNPVRFVVLDFSAVAGADASARTSLAKLLALLARRKVTIVFSGLSNDMQLTFEQAGLFRQDETHRVFTDHNRAIEWCESKLMEPPAPIPPEETLRAFDAWLVRELGSAGAARTVLGYVSRLDVAAGETIYKAGTKSDSLDFIANGTLDIMIPTTDGGTVVARRMARETIIGEMGFFRGAPRNATIVAETAAILYCLRRDRFARMEVEAPAVALALQKFVIRELATRLELTNRELAAWR